MKKRDEYTREELCSVMDAMFFLIMVLGVDLIFVTWKYIHGGCK